MKQSALFTKRCVMNLSSVNQRGGHLWKKVPHALLSQKEISFLISSVEHTSGRAITYNLVTKLINEAIVGVVMILLLLLLLVDPCFPRHTKSWKSNTVFALGAS